MDTENQGNSEASSQESDNQAEKKPSNEDTTGVGRSYECTFCKRGFTNAQALGGHMNIHRKDKAKAKAKQKNQEEASNKSNSRYASQVSNENHQQQRGNAPRLWGGERNQQVYMPSQNPSFQSGNFLPLWKPDYGARIASNLSLRIGVSPPRDEGGEGRDGDNNVKENDVDLELRLGHQP